MPEGSNNRHQSPLGARDLLAQLLEAWTCLEQHRWEQPPAMPQGTYFRYLRIAALCRALDLGTVDDVVRGTFLGRRDPSTYRDLALAIIAHSASDAGSAEPTGSSTAALRFAYVNLLSYRARAERLLSYNRGLLEAGFPEVRGYANAIDEVNAKLAPCLREIEGWLAACLDPVGRCFSFQELVDRFGYPDVDLSEIDIDEL